MNIVKISLNKIKPDLNQPRKYFDEASLGRLKKSIKVHGIKNPLTVQLRKDGTYLIVDGERRFRAAQELALKEVPVLIEPETSEEELLIEQFHIQEQHEGWTAVEKANAIVRFAELMKVTLQEAGELLGISLSSMKSYIAFNKIVDKKNFERSRMNIRWSAHLLGIKGVIKKILQEAEIEYDRPMEKALENAIFTRVNKGEELNTYFFTKIKDSIKQDPKIIHEFIENDDLTVDKMFTKTKARGAMLVRRLFNNMRYITSEAEFVISDKSVKVDPEVVKAAKKTQAAIEKFIKTFEE